MSLRWRVALVVAAITVATAGVLTVVAYRLTSSELVGQVDLDLNNVVTELELPAPQPGSRPARPEPGSLFFPGSPLPSTAPSGAAPVAAAQHLDARGIADNSNGVLRIPVQAVDVQLAEHAGPSVVRDETIGGTAYRVLTAHTVAGGALQVAISLTAVDRSLHALLWRFTAGALVTAVLAALAGWLLATRITRPLERLAAGAATVARTGTMSIEHGSSRHDEVGRLTASMSAMLDSLSRSREEQQRLVQDAGHELRTPLTSACSNAELLAMHDGQLTDEDRRRLVSSLRDELSGLVMLVNELEELATDSASTEPLTLVDMHQLVESAAERCSARSGRRVEVTGAAWTVRGRRNALERAVSNLLENGVKFSPAGSGLEVDVSPGRVTVRDHGEGIPVSDRERIFDRFYRVPTPVSRPGSGLGLSIVQKVVVEHGGRVFAAGAEGGGAVVGFELPLAD